MKGYRYLKDVERGNKNVKNTSACATHTHIMKHPDKTRGSMTIILKNPQITGTKLNQRLETKKKILGQNV